MSDAQDLLLRRDEGPVARLTLNRPHAYNALSLAMMEALIVELGRLSDDASIKCVVLEGAGRGFCAGHDLKELQANPGVAFREQTFSTCSELMQAIVGLRQPVIAKVHGIATAAGCQLVATCDLALADSTARFGTPGVNIGLFCSTPMVALSRAVHPKLAMEMLLTGQMIDADRAERIGLINAHHGGEALEEAVSALAATVASKSGLVLKTGKEAFYQQVEMGLADAYAHTSRVMVENMGFQDAEQGIAAFIDKRHPPEWQNR